jgi:hypothetical protein
MALNNRITLYDLVLASGCTISPFVWRTKYALKHKGFDIDLVPNGFNRRVLMTLNLREAYHFCELRSAANAHFSIRRIALRMAELIRQVHPALASFMRLPDSEDWRKVEAEHFGQG